MSPRRLVVLPTYQEAENIPVVVPRIREACPDADILVVDDASPDGTADAAERLGATVLRRTGKRGLGPAYADGFAWGLERGYDFFVGMDADLSHDPAVLPTLFGLVEDGADMAIGSRYIDGGAIPHWPAHRRALSRWGNRYATAALRLPVSDATTGYRAFSADILRRVHAASLRASGYGFLIELVYRVARAGGKIVETPIVFVDRERGTSKMNSRIIAEAMTFVTLWGLRDRLARLRPSR
ncbi:MAG: polyprenol monophosphomannose synthase [Actinobacteria bacterium]|nr:polyprenol monophosphomannose synthase [Actinomycetota bacterium]